MFTEPPLCAFEGLISGDITIHDRCSLAAAWVVYLECGHSEAYCFAHKQEFATLLSTAVVVCPCGYETHNTKTQWAVLP